MADIEEIRKKIDRLIQQNGLNYRDVSLKIGRKDSYMQQYVKYGFPKRLKEMDRIRLAQLLKIDDTEIADDEIITAKTVPSPQASHSLTDFIKAGSVPENPLQKIDIITRSAVESSVSEPFEQADDKCFIGKNVLDNLTDTPAETLKIIKIESDSMQPVICSGDWVLVDTSCRIPRTDGLYLFLNGQTPIVRQIQISPIDGSVDIRAAHPAYKSYVAESPEKIAVFGRVLYRLQRV